MRLFRALPPKFHPGALCTSALCVSLVTGLGVVATTAWGISPRLYGAVYIPPVSFVSYQHGLLWGIATALVSLLSYDYFILPRVGQVFDDPNGILFFAVILATSLFTNWLTQKVNTLRIHSAEVALAAANRLLATVSHEVRTPMTGIMSAAELLSLQDLGAENNFLVQAVLQSSKRLLQVLNNLLDIVRMKSGAITLEHREFPIRSVLGDVRQLIAQEAQQKNLRVSGTCDSAIPEMLCGDELRLRQILTNIAFNAVKFTDSGEVNVSATLRAHDTHKTIVRFTVSDTGIGISPEDRPKVFEPFVQVRETTRGYGGSGLGLPICESLVQLMEGVIGFDSQPGQGSTFWFEIPFFAEKWPK